jgi:Tfp pilus assembly protein PilF
MLGQLYVQQNKPGPAIQKFEELGKRQSKPVVAYTMIAMILQTQGKSAEAQTRYEKVIEIDPRAAVAANNLAWMYAEGGGNLDTALQLARTAKEQLPDTPQVNDTLGWIYVKKALPSLAVPLLQAAVEKDANNATYHFHLGMAYKNSDPVKAKASLEKALKLNPNFEGSAEARKALAEIG